MSSDESIGMREEQFKAFLNTIMDGYQKTIAAIASNSKDHDLLVEMKTLLTLQIERQNKLEEGNIPIRNNVQRNTEHIDKCLAEKHDDMIKRNSAYVKKAIEEDYPNMLKSHEKFIYNFSRGGWLIITGANSVIFGIILSTVIFLMQK